MLESYSCNSKDELLLKEREWLEKYIEMGKNVVNCYKPNCKKGDVQNISNNVHKYSIYSLVCKNPEVKHTYIGSTRLLEFRKMCHKQRTNYEKGHCYNLPLYQCIREFGGWDNWQLILLEEAVCTKREAEAIERKWIEEKGADLNSCKRPFITEEERELHRKYSDKKYREENAEIIAIKQKEYREEEIRP